jgi:hypothetical protein
MRKASAACGYRLKIAKKKPPEGGFLQHLPAYLEAAAEAEEAAAEAAGAAAEASEAGAEAGAATGAGAEAGATGAGAGAFSPQAAKAAAAIRVARTSDLFISIFLKDVTQKNNFRKLPAQPQLAVLTERKLTSSFRSTSDYKRCV